MGKYPTFLYVRAEKQDSGEILYYAETSMKDARDSDGPDIQGLAVYRVEEIIETVAKLEVRTLEPKKK